jgi:hypothetical protein
MCMRSISSRHATHKMVSLDFGPRHLQTGATPGKAGCSPVAGCREWRMVSRLKAKSCPWQALRACPDIRCCLQHAGCRCCCHRHTPSGLDMRQRSGVGQTRPAGAAAAGAWPPRQTAAAAAAGGRPSLRAAAAAARCGAGARLPRTLLAASDLVALLHCCALLAAAVAAAAGPVLCSQAAVPAPCA